MSDDSDYDDDAEQEEIDVYKRKYQLLAERCEVLQQVRAFVCHWVINRELIFD